MKFHVNSWASPQRSLRTQVGDYNNLMAANFAAAEAARKAKDGSANEKANSKSGVIDDEEENDTEGKPVHRNTNLDHDTQTTIQTAMEGYRGEI